MTLPENAPARKPRRVWLYAPFVVLLVAVAAWTVGWNGMRRQVFRQMDDYARASAESGYRIDWTSRSLSGFPFRLDLDVVGPRLMETSGWGLSAPRLKAEAFVFSADHWIVVAPEGATLLRRVGGPVTIAAKALRASLSDATAHPARISVEGVNLTFTAPPGSAPSALTSAAELHIHSKAGPSDQGAVYLELDDARTAGSGPLAVLAGPAPVTLKADAIFTHANALTGPGIAGALRSWSQAGGGLTIRDLSLRTAGTRLESRSGDLAIDSSGRLSGRLDLTAKPGQRLLSLLSGRDPPQPQALHAAEAILAARTTGDAAQVTVHFQAGQTTLGPVGVGAAPRVY